MILFVGLHHVAFDTYLYIYFPDFDKLPIMRYDNVTQLLFHTILFLFSDHL